jgi:uncharacterized Zn-binding protein involved in type VI secretion
MAKQSPGRPAQREGDFNGGGGIIVGGESSVQINGRPAAYPGLLVLPHIPCSPKKFWHCIAVTVSLGSGSVRVNGKPLLLTGDYDTCTHKRAGGSPNVRAV